jgi:hypothetical protein
MKFNTYLRNQLADFVEVYNKFWVRTFNVALLLSLTCFIIVGVLGRIGSLGPIMAQYDISLLNFFFSTYSSGEHYYLPDLSMIIFAFAVSLFSLGLARIRHNEPEESEYKLKDFLSEIKGNDIFDLGLVLIVSSLIDYFLYKAGVWAYSSKFLGSLHLYVWHIAYFIRIYLPLTLFSIFTFRLINGKKFRFSFTAVLFLLVSLWIYHSIAVEIWYMVQNYVFDLVLLPFRLEAKLIAESLLGVVLMALFIPGLQSAMISSLKFMHSENNS